MTKVEMGQFHILLCEEIIFPLPKEKMNDWGTKSSFLYCCIITKFKKNNTYNSGFIIHYETKSKRKFTNLLG